MSIDEFADVVQKGLDCGIVNHSNIYKLKNYSQFVNFITGIRNRFLNEFSAYTNRGEFGMVDGEALFVGN